MMPDKSIVESVWNGDSGDSIELLIANESVADAYGEKSRSFTSSSPVRGRVKVLNANEIHKELGYLVPGDAIALLKLGTALSQKDRVKFNSITYGVAGIVQKKTHIEVALKRIT